jgi:hypothetical protein
MKRFLPLTILILVSFFVFVCALGVVYVLSVDATTAEEKMQSLLTLGVPSGAALIALMWFGVGMDVILSRLKNKSTRVGVSLLTYIFVPLVLCVGLPALIGLGIYTTFNAPQGWKQFPAPPQPAVEIISANGTSLAIRTESDAQLYCVIGCTDWQSVAEVDPRRRRSTHPMGPWRWWGLPARTWAWRSAPISRSWTVGPCGICSRTTTNTKPGSPPGCS